MNSQGERCCSRLVIRIELMLFKLYCAHAFLIVDTWIKKNSLGQTQVLLLVSSQYTSFILSSFVFKLRTFVEYIEGDSEIFGRNLY